jgi:ArsR family transcriptional regulator
MFEKHAQLIKVIGDPVRLKILGLLEKGEKTVGDIGKKLKVSQPLLSHHLKIMKYEGLIVSRKDGKYVYYGLINKAVVKLIDCIIVCCDQVMDFRRVK